MEQNPNTPNTPRVGHSWLTRLLAGGALTLALTTLGVVGVAGYFGHKLHQERQQDRRDIASVIANLKVINRHRIISEIVNEQVGDTLTQDQKSMVAFEIDEGCRRIGVEPHIVLALIEQESRWKWNAFNAASTATGFFQVTYETGIHACREAKVPFTKETLMDPVRNTSMGIQVLADKHAACVAAGVSSPEDWSRALWNYCGKGDSYFREVMARSVKYKDRLDAPLQGAAQVAPEVK